MCVGMFVWRGHVWRGHVWRGCVCVCKGTGRCVAGNNGSALCMFTSSSLQCSRVGNEVQQASVGKLYNTLLGTEG